MVIQNDHGFGGGFGMRSSSSISALNTMNAKAAEAELISRATQTAIVAARSILMSGGSEEVALKTAKAAAESVLNPMGSDNDTVSGRSSLGSAFGGRKRKAKRQAEVVASMALMSATSGIRPAGSGLSMSEWDSGPSLPYGRNIITFRHDEPSVLSGSISTRPPRAPTPKSSASTGTQQNNKGSYPAVVNQPSPLSSGSHRAFSSKKVSEASQSKASAASPRSSGKSESPSDHEGSKATKEKKKDKSKDDIPSSNFLDKILNIKVGETTPKNSEKGSNSKVPEKLFQMESDSVGQSETMDSERQSSVESSIGDESTTADTVTVNSASNNNTSSRRESKEKEGSWKVNFDPLLVKVTNTLNIFTCGPLGPFASGEAADDLEGLESLDSTSESPGRRPRQDRRSAAMESRDDTFDDNTTNFTYDDTNTEMTGGGDTRDGDDYSDYRDADFGLIESNSSDSSNDLLRDLGGMSDTSEGKINVRSSIRETMEKIVSKSKRGHHRRNSSRGSRKWHSHHQRQEVDEPEIPVHASATKKKTKKTSSSSNSRRTPTTKSSTKSVGKKQSFFFSKKTKGGH